MKLFYHYCSVEKFCSIISTKTLWLTNIIKSNDTQEIIRTYKYLWTRIRAQLLKHNFANCNSRELILTIDQQVEIDSMTLGKDMYSVLGVCLSVNRDLAQNWNEYGDKGRGVALGFSSELFKGIKNNRPHPNAQLLNAIGWGNIIYDNNDILKQLTESFITIIEENKDNMSWIIIPSTLRHYAAFIKNPSYIDEREVRIVYYPSEDHSGFELIGMSSKENHPIEHAALSWNKKDGCCALKEIIIGTNCPLTQNEIENKIGDLKGKISILKSEYSYTDSNNR